MPLAEPKFIDTDPGPIEAEMVAYYENATGKTLQPAQPERLLIKMLAYRESLVRKKYQAAAVQNLVPFAKGVVLDYLALLVGLLRLEATPATCTIRFYLQAGHGGTVLPSGLRITTNNSARVFTSDEDLVIPAGATEGTVTATCDTEGTAGNGYLPGEVNGLLDLRPFVLEALNDDETAGGANEESDEQLRQRIMAAPSQFSTAGSRASYRYHALAAHPSITDVAVTSSSQGRVELYPLTVDGLPDAAVLAAVLAACSEEKTRPLTDTVEASPPAEVGYTIEAVLTRYDSADATDTLEAAQAAANAHADFLRAKLGRDIDPDQVRKALMVDGVARLTLTSPALRELGPTEWANCTGINITMGGSTNG